MIVWMCEWMWVSTGGQRLKNDELDENDRIWVWNKEPNKGFLEPEDLSQSTIIEAAGKPCHSKNARIV